MSVGAEEAWFHWFLSIALPAFLFVGLRSIQQLNVMHHRISWVIPTSLCMALCEVTSLLNVIKGGWWSWVPMFAGGCSGCVLAMHLHLVMRRRDMDRIEEELYLGDCTPPPTLECTTPPCKEEK